jgi:predicted dehydrogenase
MRFGLVGCGWAGSLRAAAIARTPGFRLVAVADADLDRARRLAAGHDAVAGTDWRAVTDRGDLDALVVATPPGLHAEIGVRALEAGRHVLCEKPLARTPAECRQMLAAAERSGRVLATGFNYRFYPAIAKAREIVAAGLIGDLDHVRSYAGHPGGREFTHPWVHDVEVVGGGALMDNGIHLIDLTRHFLGEVAEVTGVVTGHVWGFPGCEDNGFALLRSPEGRVASLQASWSEWRGYRFAIEVYGTRGCIRASYPPMLTQLVQPAPAGGGRRRIHLFPWHQVVERLRSYRWTALQSFRRELEAFARATRGEASPLARGRDGLRSVQIAHAVYQATTTGATVRLDG